MGLSPQTITNKSKAVLYERSLIRHIPKYLDQHRVGVGQWGGGELSFNKLRYIYGTLQTDDPET